MAGFGFPFSPNALLNGVKIKGAPGYVVKSHSSCYNIIECYKQNCSSSLNMISMIVINQLGQTELAMELFGIKPLNEA